MQARQYWKVVTADRSDLLDRLLALLEREHVRWCVVGGQGVNAYVEPVVSLDLDLVIAAEDLRRLETALGSQFRVERFPHSMNLGAEGSDLRVQVQTDSRYEAFIERSTPRDVLGLRLPVAAVDDVLQGKLWAVQDPTRRASKRQKDLADIARLLEAFPEYRSRVPAVVLDKLL